MRNRFDEQLEQLNVELIKTGALCEDAISTTAKALIDNDRELARRVKPIEREIDQKERDIESLCMKLLLQQGSVSESKLHIKEMAQATIKMVTDSIESFVRRDLPLARSVVEYDNVVDGLFNKVKTELIRLISEDSNNGEFCIDLLMVAKYFERIGDHAVNVAEWVQYSLTGRKGSLLADADDIPWTEDMA